MAMNRAGNDVLLTTDHLEGISRLRQDLRQARYPGDSIQKVLGTAAGSKHSRRDLPLFVRRLSQNTPINTLVKLFALQVSVTEAEAQAAFESLGLDGAVSLGLVECDNGKVRATVSLSCHDGLFLTHDLEPSGEEGLRADQVLGLNPAAFTLASLTVRRPIGLALDIGCGSGIQALLAARHSKRVIATDTNPRALQFTLFNARLNDLTNIECRQGSLFDPVAEFRFDLIVCNPPFVISPDSTYQFRDSGKRGDLICREIVRALPQYLVEGGFASILCNWSHERETAWSAPLKDWVAANGCDCLLFHGETQDPLTYAAVWSRSTDIVRYEARLDRWMAYYRELGIGAISYGGIIMRLHPMAPNWVHAEELPKKIGSGSSESILRLFAAQDYLAALGGDHRLLDNSFRVADGIRIDQAIEMSGGQLTAQQMRLQLQDGIHSQVAIDAQIFQVLTRLNGKRTLAEALGMVSPEIDLGSVQLADAICRTFRRLIELGFLIPGEQHVMSSAFQGGQADLAVSPILPQGT